MNNENSVNLSLSPSMQREIVSLTVRSRSFASKLFTLVLGDSDLEKNKIRMFTNPVLDKIVHSCKNLYMENEGIMPTEGIFETHIMDLEINNDLKSAIIKEYHALMEMTFQTSHLHIKGVRDILVVAKTSSFINNIFQDMENPDKSKFLSFSSKCKDFAETIDSIDFEDSGEVDMSNWFDLIVENADSAVSNIGFNIEEICSELNGGGENGGFARKEVGVIVAGTNDGKTILTTSIACDNIRIKNNTYIIGLEGKKLQTPLRMISNLARVKYKKLTRYREYVMNNDKPELSKYFTKDEVERISEGQEKFAEFCNFNHAIQNCEIEKLISLIETAHKKKAIDLLIIDYGQLIESIKKYKRGDLLIQDVFRKLEKLASRMNAAIVVPMQVNRDGLNYLKEEVRSGNDYPSFRMAHVAGGYGSLKTAGTVLAMSRTDEERKTGKYRIKILKQREGLVEIEVGLKGDWEYSNLTSGQRYYLDSPTMDNLSGPVDFTEQTDKQEISILDKVLGSPIMKKYSEVDMEDIMSLEKELYRLVGMLSKIKALEELKVQYELEDHDDLEIVELDLTTENDAFFDECNNSEELSMMINKVFRSLRDFEELSRELTSVAKNPSILKDDFPSLFYIFRIIGAINKLELSRELS